MDYEKWKYYGQELRRLRDRAGLTQRQLASRAGLSHGMIGALERALRAPKADYSEKFDTILETSGMLSRVYRDIVGRRDVPDWFRDALTLETRASEIWEWEPLAVPGLLQCEGYARALDTGRRLKPDPDGVEQVVTTRLARLPGIGKNGTIPTLIAAESALRYTVGTPALMRGQLDHIGRLVDEQKILFQVLSACAPPLVLSLPFRVMKLGKTLVGYVEHADGGTLVDHPERVEALSARFTRLSAEAMSPGESREFLRRLGNHHELANK